MRKDITRGYSFEDNIVFHLKRLIKQGLVNRRCGKYHLTKQGLEFSGKFSLSDLEDRKYKTAYIAFICKFNNWYLIREHVSGNSKFYKFPGGKPFLGETMLDACKRIFKAETSIELPYKNFHIIVFTLRSNLHQRELSYLTIC